MKPIHPDSLLFKSCPFGEQSGPLPGGRVVKECGKRFCNLDHRARGLVVLATCLACPHHGSVEVIPKPLRVGDVLDELVTERFGQSLKTVCQCASHLEEISQLGPDRCVEQADTIVGWLIEASRTVARDQDLDPKWLDRAAIRPLILEAAEKVRAGSDCPTAA